MERALPGEFVYRLSAAAAPLRVGFLGVGTIAQNHVAALQSLGHTVSSGCATSVDSPRWKGFQAMAPNARFESDASALLADPEIDAVVACLPWNLTESWLPQLLATPKPTLIEKPIALTSEALSQAINQAETSLENKYVGFNRRFYGAVQALKKRVEQGGVKSIEITISETVKGLAEAYGDEIIDHVLAYSSCHTLDTAIHVFGPLKPIKVYGSDDPGYPRPFRSLTGLLETTLGAPVMMSIMADNPTPIGIRIFFDDRTTWNISPLEHLVAYRDYEVIEPTHEINIRRYIPKPFLEINEDFSFKPGFLEQMRAFTNGDRRQILASIEDSLELLRFIESTQDMAQSVGLMSEPSSG